MDTMSVHAETVIDIAEWVEEQLDNLSTVRVQLSFATGELELYDYETGIVHSKRPLTYFKA